MAYETAQFLTFILVLGTAWAIICYRCDTTESRFCKNITVDCTKEMEGNFSDNWIPQQCLLVIATTLALTCYKCDSSENKLCAYGISSFTYNTVNCDEDIGGNTPLTNWIPKQCVKLVAKGKDDTEYIARGCMPESGGACSAIAKTLSFFTSIQGDIEEMNCYPCDGDKCNSANKFTEYTLMGVILAAFVYMF